MHVRRITCMHLAVNLLKLHPTRKQLNMAHRNLNFAQLQRNYLFVEIANRREKLVADNPNAKIISLGIGDTTEPLSPAIVQGMESKLRAMATVEGYTGYPDYNGSATLRSLIAKHVYKGTSITADDIFISDGSKPDLTRLQLLFPPDTTVAVQDPVYPVYVDSSVIAGKAGEYDAVQKRYSRIVYMPCNPENGFFPDLTTLPRADLIFFCSPNNPTGAVATRSQLESLVAFAKKHQSIIIYDSAYRLSPQFACDVLSQFIRDPELPKTIYEIPGAEDVAFETCSLSKSDGFTGVRLGWTVCPKTLLFCDGTPVQPDWARIMGTCFNGANCIAEHGAIAAFSPEGMQQGAEQEAYYMENAKLIRSSLLDIGVECYGGQQSPYIWVRVKGLSSWEVFQYVLENAHVVLTPGAGFGHEGYNFVRVSSFAHREDVEEGLKRLVKALKELLKKK